eukprot:11450744-Alexandrium_andersonii.AAC.1
MTPPSPVSVRSADACSRGAPVEPVPSPRACPPVLQLPPSVGFSKGDAVPWSDDDSPQPTISPT